MAFQPVPTYQSPVEVDEKTGKSSFNPTWLSWFLTLSNGGLSSTIQHNSLLGLQGGQSGEYYHLTQAQVNNIPFPNTTLPVVVALGPSPFTYQNNDGYSESVIIKGGIVTAVEFSRDGSTFYDVGLTAGMYWLSQSDYIRITYSSGPSFVKVPR